MGGRVEGGGGFGGGGGGGGGGASNSECLPVFRASRGGNGHMHQSTDERHMVNYIEPSSSMTIQW